MVEYKIQVKVDASSAQKGAKDVEKALKGAERAGGGLEKVLKQALGAFLGFKTVKGFANLAIEADDIADKLRIVTTGQENLIQVTEQLREISNAGAASLKTSAVAYQQLALASAELGKTQGELINFLGNLELTVRASGASIDESEAAVKALSYAMSTGEVSGRALKTILQDIPTVGDAIAQHLGVTRSGLKELGDQGKISAQDLFAALEKVPPKTKELAEQNTGLQESYVSLKNELVLFVGEVDKTSGATSGATAAIDFLARSVRDLKVAYDEAANATERFHDRQNLFAQDIKTSPVVSIGAGIVNIQRQIDNLLARPIQTEGTRNMIARLRADLDKLGEKAEQVKAGIDAGVLNGLGESKIRPKIIIPGQDEPGPGAKGAAPTPGGSQKSDVFVRQLEEKKLLNEEDVRRIGFIEKVNAKLDDQLAATQALTGGDRDLALAQQLINAEQDKDVTKRTAVTQAMLDEFVAKAKLINASRDEAEAYNIVFDAQEEYERRTKALIELEKKHPEAHKQIEQSLDSLRLAYLEKSTDMADGFERAFLRIKQEANDFASVADAAVNSFADNATDALTAFVTEGKGTFKDFADAVLVDLEKILIRFLVVQAITGIVGGPAAGAIGSTAGNALSGKNANGGTEQPGRSYLVGENGPEIHQPRVTGSTAPIGGGAPQINLQVVNVKDEDEVPAAMSGGKFDRQIVNAIARNRDSVNKSLGR